MEKVWILFSAAVLILSFQNCSNGANFAATGELLAKAESDDSSDGTVIDISQPVSDNDGANTDDGTTTPPTTTPPVVVAPPTMPPSNDDVMVPPTMPPVVVVPPTMPPTDDTMVPPTMPPVVVVPPTMPPTDDTMVPPTMPPVVVVPPTMPPTDDTMVPPTMPPVVVVPPTMPPEISQGALHYVCVLRSHGKSVKIALSNEGTLGGKTGTPSDVCMSENACLNILSKSFDVVSAEKRGFCPNKNPHVIAMTDMQIQAALARAALLISLAP